MFIYLMGVCIQDGLFIYRMGCSFTVWGVRLQDGG